MDCSGRVRAGGGGCRSNVARLNRPGRLALVLLAGGVTGALQGQALPIDPPPIVLPYCNQPPDTGGQWGGPWNLEPQINRGAEPRKFSEIAHAVVLPPPNDGWILLWCARYCGNVKVGEVPVPRPYETFLWNPQNPGIVVRLTVPSAPTYGSDDFFCGGQIVTQDGLVIVFGGTNIAGNCYAGEPFDAGHRKVWIFDNRTKIDLNTTPWTLPSWIENAATEDMLRSRWYATCCVVYDGRIVVGAHAGPDPPGTLPHSSRIREYGRLSLAATPQFIWDDSPVGESFWRNWRYSGIGFSACTMLAVEGQGDMSLESYEHVRQLTDGRLIAFNSRRKTTLGYPLHQTFFLELDACLSTPADTERWVAGPGDPALIPNLEGAPSVHLIDDSGESPREVLYSLGGGGNETSCSADTTNQVLKMVLPVVSPATAEAWEVAPQHLNRKRNDGNAGVGLDGSIIVDGGLKPIDDDTDLDLIEDNGCVPVMIPERFRPPEIFKTGDTMSWHDLCPQAHQRSYHSTFWVQSDGRFGSAGGTDPICATFCDPPLPCQHSIELYSPPYLFQGERPEILNPVLPTGIIKDVIPGESLFLDVQLPGTTNPESEFRVALLRPGSVTHSNDTSQRYIKVKINSIFQTAPPDSYTIEVRIPLHYQTAPAGHYMVTVVSSEGVPSVAKWIRIH